MSDEDPAQQAGAAPPHSEWARPAGRQPEPPAGGELSGPAAAPEDQAWREAEGPVEETFAARLNAPDPTRPEPGDATVAQPGVAAQGLFATHPETSGDQAANTAHTGAATQAQPDVQANAQADQPGHPNQPATPAAPRAEWVGPGAPPAPPAGEWTAQPQNPAAQQSPWAAPAQERVVFGTAAGERTPPRGNYLPNPNPPFQPAPRVEQPRKKGGGLVAGVAVLALLVGGGAGALGGYLVADSKATPPVVNALNQEPAKNTSNTPPAAGSVEAVAAKVSPAVVQLQVRGRSAAGEGSGFIISSDGLIMTNNHVVEVAADGGEITVVFADGSQSAATIVGRDPTSDVAVVKAENKQGLPTVQLGDSDQLKVGEGVVAIGSPYELSGTVTSGIVSSLHRPTRAGGEDGSQATVLDAIQTDAAINPGNSGGPLVNMQGQVIGINSAIYSPQSSQGSQGGFVGIGFAIPMNQARRTADEIVKTGKATQTVLGVTVRDNQNGGGALVNEVTQGGPAEQAGIKSGDVITKVGDRRIDTSDALVAAIRSHKPGDKVRLELSNGSRTVDATLAGQPVEPQ